MKPLIIRSPIHLRPSNWVFTSEGLYWIEHLAIVDGGWYAEYAACPDRRRGS